MDERPFASIGMVYLYGHPVQLYRAYALRKAMIDALVGAEPPFLAASDIPAAWLEVVPPASSRLEAKPDSSSSILCEFYFWGSPITRIQAQRLRLLFIEFLIAHTPQLLGLDEVEHTFLTVMQPRGDEPGRCILAAFFGRKTPDTEDEGVLIVQPYPAFDARRLKHLGQKNYARRIKRFAGQDEFDGGIYHLFVVSQGWEPVADEHAGSYLVPPQEKEAVSGVRLSREELVNLLLSDEPITSTSRMLSAGSSKSSAGEVQPVSAPQAQEARREPPSLERLRTFLSSRVIGQERAVRQIVRAFNLAKASFLSEESTILTVFFAGPTAVGKTEMAYALADFLWEEERRAIEEAKRSGKALPLGEKDIAARPLVEIDCGMFAGELGHGIANLIGSPVGYVGSKSHKEGAQEPILRPQNFPPHRITVLLFDEFEKAFVESRDQGAMLQGILMKILDKARLVNRWEEEVDFSRTVIIFTSNIGSTEIMEDARKQPIGFAALRGTEMENTIEDLNEEIYKLVKAQYEKIFRPELRSRIHRLIVFRFLVEREYVQIIEKEFRAARERAKARAGIELQLGKDAFLWILKEIKREEGVRTLRNFLSFKVMEEVARLANLKRFKRGDIVEVRTKEMRGESGEMEIEADIWMKRGDKFVAME